MRDGWFTEDERPQRGNDGWYIVWQFDDPETGRPTDYAERFDTEEEAQAALTGEP
jgi:hypothetical protein